jgi:hypothetical protein
MANDFSHFTADSAGQNHRTSEQDLSSAAGPIPSLLLSQPIFAWRARFTATPEPADQTYGRPFGEKRRQQIVRSQLASQSQLQPADLHPEHVLVAGLGTSDTELSTLQQIHQWLDSLPSSTSDVNTAQWISLPGTQLLWHPRCLLVSATSDRSDRICQAALEVTFFAAELQSLESAVDDAWDSTLQDVPLGFEFSTADIPRRSSLGQRFQTVCQLRTRHARLLSQIIVPHVYPPTIASQIGERLRERLRLAERMELIDQRLSAQESIYERCSQRCSDFMVARTGHHLEWIIIILLAFQTLLWIVDLLSSGSGASPTIP